MREARGLAALNAASAGHTITADSMAREIAQTIGCAHRVKPDGLGGGGGSDKSSNADSADRVRFGGGGGDGGSGNSNPDSADRFRSDKSGNGDDYDYGGDGGGSGNSNPESADRVRSDKSGGDSVDKGDDSDSYYSCKSSLRSSNSS